VEGRRKRQGVSPFSDNSGLFSDVKVLRFLYALVVCLDANFRLKNLVVSSYSRDPNLGIGWAYMVERSAYEKWIKSRTNEEDVSGLI